MPLTDLNLALAALAKSQLIRDDESDPDGRIYRDKQGEIYFSVTRILKETSDSKAALEAWVARLGEEDRKSTRLNSSHRT